MRNTKRELPWKLKAEIISKFSNSLRISGYNEKFRMEVIQSAVRGYEAQCDRADRGEVPLHRPRSFDQTERRKSKLMKPSSWYRPADTVLFCPPSPGGELRDIIQNVVTSEAAVLRMTVRVIETGGISLKQSLVRPDLTGCYWDDCWLCECGVKGASHTRSSAHYGGRCLECDKLGKRASYDGDTGKSGYYRTKQHQKALENANLNNALA